MAHSKVNLGESLYQRGDAERVWYYRRNRKRFKYTTDFIGNVYNSYRDNACKFLKDENNSLCRAETQQLLHTLSKVIDPDDVSYFNYNKNNYGNIWNWA